MGKSAKSTSNRAVSDWMLISDMRCAVLVVCLVACVSVQADEVPDVPGLVDKLKAIADQLTAINKAYSTFVQESAKGVEDSAGPDDGGDEVEEELEEEEEIEGEDEVEEGEEGEEGEDEEGYPDSYEEAARRHRRRMRRRRMRRMRMM